MRASGPIFGLALLGLAAACSSTPINSESGGGESGGCESGGDESGSDESGGDDELDPLPPLVSDCDVLASTLAPFGPVLTVPSGGFEALGPCGHAVAAEQLVFPDHTTLALSGTTEAEFSPTGELLFIRGQDTAQLVELASKTLHELPVDPDQYRGWVPTFAERVGSRLWTRVDGRLELHEPGATTLIDEGLVQGSVLTGVGAPILIYTDNIYSELVTRIVNTDTGQVVLAPDFHPGWEGPWAAPCTFTTEIGYDGDFIYSGRICEGFNADPEVNEIVEWVLIDARSGLTVLERSSDLKGFSVPKRGGAWWFHDYSPEGVRGHVRLLDGEELTVLFDNVLSVSVSEADAVFVAQSSFTSGDQLLRSLDGGHTFELLGTPTGVTSIVSNAEGTAVGVFYGENGQDGFELWTESNGWSYPDRWAPDDLWLGAELLADGTALAGNSHHRALIAVDGTIISESFEQLTAARFHQQFLTWYGAPQAADVLELLAPNGARTSLVDEAQQLNLGYLEHSSLVPIVSIWAENAAETEFTLFHGRP